MISVGAGATRLSTLLSWGTHYQPVSHPFHVRTLKIGVPYIFVRTSASAHLLAELYGTVGLQHGHVFLTSTME